MPEGPIPITTHRQNRRCYSLTPNDEFHGRIIRIQPDTNASWRSRENAFLDIQGHLLLQGYVVRPEERMLYLPMASELFGYFCVQAIRAQLYGMI